MLRRIRELQADGSAAGHVTGQHVTSKVLLKRFAEPSGPHQGLICPFRLEYPHARHRLDRAWRLCEGWQLRGLGIRLGGEAVEGDRGQAAGRAGGDGRGHPLGQRGACVGDQVRDCPSLRRSKAAKVIHARVWAETVTQSRKRWVSDNRALLEYWFDREKGFYPAGEEALGIFAGELMGLSLALASSGALWRER